MPNIFQQAYEILTTKTYREMTEEERKLVSLTTTFVTKELVKVEPKYDKLPISDGLLKLAKMIEEVE